MIDRVGTLPGDDVRLAARGAGRPLLSAVEWSFRAVARLACAVVVYPLAFVLGLAASLPALVRAALTLVLAVVSLAWTAVLLVLHSASVLFHLLGLTHQRKVLLTREGLRRLAAELRADLADLAVVPRAVGRRTLRALKRGNAVINRAVKTSRVRSSQLLSTLGQRLHSHALDFEDRYMVLERLPSGGSTACLFVVRELVNGAPRGEKLVLKHFSLESGSHLENIVRESSAVKLATRLGIVRDSRMTKSSFYYVMPYYEGKTLTAEVLAIHRSLADGAAPGPAQQVQFVRWMRDLLAVIVAYHERGVFHKDIKPDNLIASGDKLHLIDIGLLTPLESTLQLTTHGTEYFRDPEMVKLAVRGTAIKDVDCAKFDVYSMGAVLFFLLEGEFPALGSLSPHRRRSPLCLQWMATRAMTDFDKRYASAREMQEDVLKLLELAAARPLEEVAVSSLPSFQAARVAGEPAPAAPEVPPAPVPLAAPAAFAPGAAPAPVFAGLPAPSVSAPVRSRRRALAAATGGLLVLMLLLVVAVYFLRSMDREAPPAQVAELFITPEAPSLTDTSPPRAMVDLGSIDLMPPAVALDRAGAARNLARLAAGFREAVLAAHPRQDGRDERLRCPVLLVPVSEEDVTSSGPLLRDVKLALAAAGVPFDPDVTPADFNRLRDGVRDLDGERGPAGSASLEDLLTSRGGSVADAPCVLGLQLREAGFEAQARAILYHPRARLDRTVRWAR